MTGNACPPEGVPVAATFDLMAEMEAYDRLPRAVRRAIANGPFKVSTPPVFRGWLARGEAAVLKAIDHGFARALDAAERERF